VGRYGERQYQLAAQKQNQAFLKYNYYQQIAKYFERECRIAKHYDSWNYRNLDPRGELEKAKKAERLHIRRNKLRNLLKDEDERYRKELEERKKIKDRQEETSLEALRQKLREKRAEQSLYLPRTCRRYQSYFICPTETKSPGWNTLKDTNLQYSRACRDSTNLIRENEQNFHRGDSRMSEDNGKASQKNSQGNVETQQEPSHSAYPRNETRKPISKYSVRYARRSLENTNVRNDDFDNNPSSRTSSRSSLAFGSSSERCLLPNGNVPLRGDDKENTTEQDMELNNSQNDTVAESRYSNSTNDQSNQSKNLVPQEDVPRQEIDENDYSKRLSMDRLNDNVDTRRPGSSLGKHSSEEDQNVKTEDTRQFEVEKSMPWLRMNPGDKNLSKQMFLYLTHKELKCKIEDLSRREMHACNKQHWDEALRLRDMRNKLELIREKKLYQVENLDLDEESRKLGLVNIDKRETELLEREKTFMDSTMYSEEAKALWKKWVHEDDKSVIKDARLQREKLMNSLEKEWQSLAVRDKERISQSYQIVMNDSALQEEHKLSAAINAAKVKSVTRP
ncbi:hypothetical protein E2986_03885, partial [Frieseomelitta varia]